jgi:predicted transcriptional regulator
VNPEPHLNELTRRERQIMNVIYRLGTATAVDVVENLPGKPKNATVRTILGVLETKGHLEHETVKGRFIYRPTVPAARVRRGMLKQLMETFFSGAEGRAVISILKEAEADLSDDEREEILRLIDRSREQGR